MEKWHIYFSTFCLKQQFGSFSSWDHRDNAHSSQIAKKNILPTIKVNSSQSKQKQRDRESQTYHTYSFVGCSYSFFVVFSGWSAMIRPQWLCHQGCVRVCVCVGVIFSWRPCLVHSGFLPRDSRGTWEWQLLIGTPVPMPPTGLKIDCVRRSPTFHSHLVTLQSAAIGVRPRWTFCVLFTPDNTQHPIVPAPTSTLLILLTNTLHIFCYFLQLCTLS